jgi:hypothetical protein
MTKRKPRRLWLGIEVISVPKGTPRIIIIDVLKESIFRGDYTLPAGWVINLRWRNSEKGKMKIGPWRKELTASASSSSGFDATVLDYLEKQL